MLRIRRRRTAWIALDEPGVGNQLLEIRNVRVLVGKDVLDQDAAVLAAPLRHPETVPHDAPLYGREEADFAADQNGVDVSSLRGDLDVGGKEEGAALEVLRRIIGNPHDDAVYAALELSGGQGAGERVLLKALGGDTTVVGVDESAADAHSVADGQLGPPPDQVGEVVDERGVAACPKPITGVLILDMRTVAETRSEA